MGQLHIPMHTFRDIGALRAVLNILQKAAKYEPGTSGQP